MSWTGNAIVQRLLHYVSNDDYHQKNVEGEKLEEGELEKRAGTYMQVNEGGDNKEEGEEENGEGRGDNREEMDLEKADKQIGEKIVEDNEEEDEKEEGEEENGEDREDVDQEKADKQNVEMLLEEDNEKEEDGKEIGEDDVLLEEECELEDKPSTEEEIGEEGIEDENQGVTRSSKNKRRVTHRTGRKVFRIKRDCPICSITVEDMSQHLARKHHLNKKQRQKFLLAARAKVPIQRAKTIRDGKAAVARQDCPLCEGRGYSRLSNHLSSVHGMSKEDIKRTKQDQKKEKARDKKEPECSGFFDRFEIYLRFGGDRSSSDESQNEGEHQSDSAAQYTRCLRYIAGITGGLENLYKDRNAVYRVYKHLRKVKNFKPKTVDKYITAMRKACEVLHIEKDDREDLNIDNDHVTRMDNLLAHIGSSLKPKIQRRESQLQDSIREDTEPVKKSFQDFAKKLKDKAIHVMYQLRHGTSVSWDSLKLYRDHLIVVMLSNGAPRTGVVANMKLEHVEKAKVQDGKHVIEVPRHKTATKYGAAQVILDEEEWGALETYRNLGRKMSKGYTDGAKRDFFFLAVNGKAVKVSQTLTRRWRELGYRGKLTPTLLRKTVVTAARDQLSPRKWKSLANYMTHSVSTANQYYAGRQKTSSNVLARDTVRRTLLLEDDTLPDTCASTSTHTAATNPSPIAASSTLVDDDPSYIPPSPSKPGASKCVDDDPADDPLYVPPPSLKSGYTKPARKRRLLSESDEEEMRSNIERVVMIKLLKPKKKRLRFREITDEVYQKMDSRVKQVMDSQQFYDKARHMGLSKLM